MCGVFVPEGSRAHHLRSKHPDVATANAASGTEGHVPIAAPVVNFGRTSASLRIASLPAALVRSLSGINLPISRTSSPVLGEIVTAVTDSKSAALVNQLDYYFSDANYPRDKFLRERADSDQDGMISIHAFRSFKRLNEIIGEPDLSESQFVDAVIAAIKAVPPFNFVLYEDQKALKRSQAVPESEMALPRTLCVEAVPGHVVWQQLFEFFKLYGNVISLRIVSKKGSDAKPHAFVEFDSAETMENVCKLDLFYDGVPLTLLTKQEFLGSSNSKRVETSLGGNSGSSNISGRVLLLNEDA